MKKRSKLLSILLLIAAISLTVFPACRFNYSTKDLKVLKEKNFTITPGKRLIVKTSSGDISISTWDKPEVYIKILGNERAARKVDFTFNATDEFIEMIAEGDNNFSFFGNNIQLRYEITVPQNFNSKIKTSGGDIHLKDLTGIQSVNTSGGDVRAYSIVGDLDIHTSGGDIYIKNCKSKNVLKTSGGNIDVRDFSEDLTCSTSGGDITLFGKDSKIDAHTSGGNIRVNYSGENKGMDLSSSGGDITIKVPDNFNASVNLKSSGGDIDNNIKSTNVTEVSDHKLIADLNNGGNLIRAITSGGNIRIE